MKILPRCHHCRLTTPAPLAPNDDDSRAFDRLQQHLPRILQQVCFFFLSSCHCSGGLCRRGESLVTLIYPSYLYRVMDYGLKFINSDLRPAGTEIILHSLQRFKETALWFHCLCSRRSFRFGSYEWADLPFRSKLWSPLTMFFYYAA